MRGSSPRTLYRDGSQNAMTTRIATTDDPDQLLYQLGAVDQLSSTWEGVLEDASVAGPPRRSRCTTRPSVPSPSGAPSPPPPRNGPPRPRTASDAAERAVADTQQHSDELYAQLATLKDTTATTEQRYELGVQVAAQKAAQQRARERAAAAQRARRRQPPPRAPATVERPAADRHVLPEHGRRHGRPGRVRRRTPAVRSAPTAGAATKFSCLVSLWNQESGWRANALNASERAYGIPSHCPRARWRSPGRTGGRTPPTQVNWGLAYIHDAYGSPCAAWNHEMSVNPHWY